MTGITILAVDERMHDAINYAYVKAIGMNLINKVYWIVTSRLPNQTEGKERLCLSKEFNSARSMSRVILFPYYYIAIRTIAVNY